MIENDNHATEILSPAIAGGAAAFLSEILLLADSTSPCVCYWNIGVTPDCYSKNYRHDDA